MITVLWLDDIRNPFIDERNQMVINESLKKYISNRNIDLTQKNEFKPDINVEWVLNYDQFIQWIEKNGLPEIISFDHDLADEHYVPPHLWHDYQKSKEYQDNQNYKEKTGLDCAKWLINYCINKDLSLPTYTIHSANPVGANNIQGILDNFKEKG